MYRRSKSYQRALKKIRLLAEGPRPDGALKFKGMGAEYRIRMGDYRLRYKVDDENQVVILGRCQNRKMFTTNPRITIGWISEA